jgi:hypothetical protein
VLYCAAYLDIVTDRRVREEVRSQVSLNENGASILNTAAPGPGEFRKPLRLLMARVRG